MSPVLSIALVKSSVKLALEDKANEGKSKEELREIIVRKVIKQAFQYIDKEIKKVELEIEVLKDLELESTKVVGDDDLPTAMTQAKQTLKKLKKDKEELTQKSEKLRTKYAKIEQ